MRPRGARSRSAVVLERAADDYVDRPALRVSIGASRVDGDASSDDEMDDGARAVASRLWTSSSWLDMLRDDARNDAFARAIVREVCLLYTSPSPRD